jgi:putative peptidoglycan lipid II flippase
VGAVGFSLYYVLLRGFYALEDTKTPALVSIGLNALNLAVSYALYRRLPQDKAVVGLALGYSIAFSVVMIVFWVLLRPRTGGLDTFVTVRTLVRLLLAGAVAGVVGWAVQDGIGRWLGQGKPASLIAVAIVVPCVFMLFALVARRLRVAEVRDVLEMIGSKLRLRPRGAA